ncbi:hypothetical protein [Kitasatospora sp. NPDC004289]
MKPGTSRYVFFVVCCYEAVGLVFAALCWGALWLLGIADAGDLDQWPLMMGSFGAIGFDFHGREPGPKRRLAVLAGIAVLAAALVAGHLLGEAVRAGWGPGIGTILGTLVGLPAGAVVFTAISTSVRGEAAG